MNQHLQAIQRAAQNPSNAEEIFTLRDQKLTLSLRAICAKRPKQ
jgi:hypothetical protein